MEEKIFAGIMDHLDIYYRIMTKYQNTPRTYGTDDLLYQTEVHTIQLIGDNPGMSLNELADRTYRTKAAMSVLIKALSKKGLVKRLRDEDDNRRYIITLTEKGQGVYQYHKDLDTVNYKKILNQMNQIENINIDELKDAYKVFHNLVKVLHEINKE